MRTLDAADFTLATPPAPLDAEGIHVWYFRGVAKSQRADILSRLLADYLGIARERVEVERDTHGKPRILAPRAPALHFNLSHSGPSLIVALSRAQALGVDIEDGLRDRPWLAIAERFFAPAEFERLAELTQARLGTAFIELWSCKEAVLKALGRGIAFGLHRLRFRWDAQGRLAGLSEIDPEAGAAAEWQVVRLAPAAGVGGALAWHGRDRPLLAFAAAARP
ncbi:MAG: 4'-phosphopantetheinyl transferase superfamily protein [Rudaea sp.]